MTLTTSPFRQALSAALLDLDYRAFLEVVAVLLRRMGYEHVEVSSRTEFVGHNRSGGYDILAYRPVAGGRRKVVVKAKQFGPGQAVYQRTVDELRGVCDRLDAAEALLVTTGDVSPVVDRDATASARVSPVRLIDGFNLHELLALYRVGVVRAAPGSTDPGRFAVDHEFFRRIESALGRGSNRATRSMPGGRETVGLVVTITARKRRA